VIEPELFSVHEAAKKLGRSEASIRALINRRQIATVHSGRRVFIPREAIQAMLRGQLFKEPRA